MAHRLGPKPTSGIDRRSIIVKFVRRSLKDEILKTARKKKAQDLYINESLTPTRQSITHAIRNARREFPEKVSGYTTIDGSIYVWIKPPNPTAPGARDSRMEVSTLAKLDKFCQKNFSFPSERFMPVKNGPSGHA